MLHHSILTLLQSLQAAKTQQGEPMYGSVMEKDASRDAEGRLTQYSQDPAGALTYSTPEYGTTGDASDGFVFLGLLLAYLVIALLVGVAVCLGSLLVFSLLGACFGRVYTKGIFDCSMVVGVVAAMLCWGHYLLDEFGDRQQRRNIGRGLIAFSREVVRYMAGIVLSRLL